jgi:hypothetical protein
LQFCQILPIYAVIEIGVFEAVSIAITRRHILPINPVATTSILETIGIEDTTVKVTTWVTIMTIVTKQEIKQNHHFKFL